MEKMLTNITSYTRNSDNVKSKTSHLKIWVYSFKKNALSLVFCLFSICLILFSNTNLVAAKNGLVLWATAVVPSLFPFFVATELLSHTTLIPWLGKYLSPIMRPIFGIPGEGAFAFLMGMISGYPVGAKIVSDFKEKGICTQEEAERMLAFTNNSGPLFIIGTVGISLFGSSLIGILLLVTHILGCVTVGIILHLLAKRHQKKGNITSSAKSSLMKGKNSNEQSISISSLGEILGKSITNAISTIMLIGGFVVIFSVILSILTQSHILSNVSAIMAPLFSLLKIPKELVNPLLAGIIELTNGVNLVAHVHLKSISTNIILCAFLLGFGGISILLQVFSITSKAGLSLRKYVIGKLLQGCFAAFYVYLALQFIPIFQLNL